MLVAALLSACGSSDDVSSNERRVIELSAGGTTYALEVPEAFLLNDRSNSALLKAAYPGMVPFSPEIRERFRHQGVRAQDAVLILLTITLPRSDADRDRKFANRNDLGRFALENSILPSLQTVPLTEPVASSDRVKKYVGSQEYQTQYVIEQQDGRISVVRCSNPAYCDGWTTWSGAFAIEYHFGRSHFADIVDLDQSVLALVASFSPRPVESGG